MFSKNLKVDIRTSKVDFQPPQILAIDKCLRPTETDRLSVDVFAAEKTFRRRNEPSDVGSEIRPSCPRWSTLRDWTGK